MPPIIALLVGGFMDCVDMKAILQAQKSLQDAGADDVVYKGNDRGAGLLLTINMSLQRCATK